MVLNFRMILGAGAAIGIAIGVAFGAGVGVGHSSAKTVNTGLTQQQIQSLLGVSGAAGAGSSAQASGTPGARGGGAGALGNNTTGQITAISGSTLTIQTATQTTVEVNLQSSSKVNTLQSGSTSDLKVGESVVVAGTRKDDGSVDATSVSQLPPELQTITAGAGGRPGASGTQTP